MLEAECKRKIRQGRELTYRIYSELAEQYKVLDAASAIAKRHVLADHLKEVIDTLEQKVRPPFPFSGFSFWDLGGRS